MSGYVKGTNRDQLTLFPEALDDYVGEGNVVRFIDEYVDELKLEDLNFRHATPARTGRPPYHPGDLLKLYIYGCLNRVRTSRRLERETHRNLEVMWLLKKLTPDHKTIAQFRRVNGKSLKAVFSDFVNLCRFLDLVGGQVVAVDGSKFRASNSKARNFNKKKINKKLKRLEKLMEKYLSWLDDNDRDDDDNCDLDLSRENLEEKIEKMKERRKQLEGHLEKIESGEVTQVSLTDPDSRLMKDGSGANVCYNVQTAVDAKHGLIIACRATSRETDQNLLSEMAVYAKNVLEAPQLTVVADRGYFKAGEIKRCFDESITTYVPDQKRKVAQKNGVPGDGFLREKFHYDRVRDVYICPAGRDLKFWYIKESRGRKFRAYRCDGVGDCPFASECTTCKDGRSIQRWEHEEMLENHRARTAARPEMMVLRKSTVEHPFGTMKRSQGHDHILLRGREKVDGEVSLYCLGFNISRALNILGVKKLIEAVRMRAAGLLKPLEPVKPRSGNLPDLHPCPAYVSSAKPSPVGKLPGIPLTSVLNGLPADGGLTGLPVAERLTGLPVAKRLTNFLGLNGESRNQITPETRFLSFLGLNIKRKPKTCHFSQ